MDRRTISGVGGPISSLFAGESLFGFNAFFDPGMQTIATRPEGRAAESRPQTGNVAGLNNDALVEAGGLQSHEWKRVERLEAVWELARRGLGSPGSMVDSGLAGAVTEPKRRPEPRDPPTRTPHELPGHPRPR